MGNGTSPATTAALLAETNRLLAENIRLTKILIHEVRDRTADERRATLLKELALEQIPGTSNPKVPP
ncbi:MAG: hypothetical protein GC208_10460 [Alphaproteobacteria bacterium]|nr:hypothetical protein [Alphaproteobacteria bacterium]